MKPAPILWSTSVIGRGGRRKAKKHLRRKCLVPMAPGAHCFNQPHQKSQKERNHNEQGERKKQQPLSPASSFLSSSSGWGATSGAQGHVLGCSTKQTIEFHFLLAPELGQHTWGHRMRARVWYKSPLEMSPVWTEPLGSCRTHLSVQSRPLIISTRMGCHAGQG